MTRPSQKVTTTELIAQYTLPDVLRHLSTKCLPCACFVPGHVINVGGSEEHGRRTGVKEA